MVPVKRLYLTVAGFTVAALACFLVAYLRRDNLEDVLVGRTRRKRRVEGRVHPCRRRQAARLDALRPSRGALRREASAYFPKPNRRPRPGGGQPLEPAPRLRSYLLRPCRGLERVRIGSPRVPGTSTPRTPRVRRHRIRIGARVLLERRGARWAAVGAVPCDDVVVVGDDGPAVEGLKPVRVGKDLVLGDPLDREWPVREDPGKLVVGE